VSVARPIDAVVIGLGPAGASAAAVLAGAGFEVLAIDRRTAAGEPVQCAEFVPAVIGSEVPDLAPVCLQPIDSMLTFVESEAPDQMPNFPGMMIDRRAFDAYLVERAIRAGASCRFGVRLRSLSADGTLSVGEGERVAPRILIGADGPRSVVGAAIGSVNRDLVETRQIRVRMTAPHSATDVFLRADIPGGYGWLFPRGDVANLGLGVRPEDRAALKPLLAALHESLIAAGRVGPEILGHTGGAIPVGGLLDPVGKLGAAQVLLAGDAAGLTNPVTGAGINSAAVSGRLAGEFAAEWLAGKDAALQDYRDELDFLFGGALERALARRARLLRTYETGGPTARDLRDGWIAYPQYWAA
jgi:geranylgeranyl reductase family protein